MARDALQRSVIGIALVAGLTYAGLLTFTLYMHLSHG
jgi:hypothetical protein